MDTPGEGKYIKSIMKAVWMADVAIMVVQDSLVFDAEEHELKPQALRFV